MGFRSQIKKHNRKRVRLRLSSGHDVKGMIMGTTTTGAFFDFMPDGEPHCTVNTDQVVTIERLPVDLNSLPKVDRGELKRKPRN